MNFNEVKELISILDDSKLAYFELENEDGYIKIDKSMSRDYVPNKIQNEVSAIENKEEKQNNNKIYFPVSISCIYSKKSTHSTSIRLFKSIYCSIIF